MNLKPQYNFKEFELGADFATDKLKDFKAMIDKSLSFTVLSMPGVGVSYFLRYLVGQKFAFFIHVDFYLLPSLTQHEFYKLLLTQLGGKTDSKSNEQMFLEIKDRLKQLCQTESKIVIIFSRFDQLKKESDVNFLSNLQALTTIDRGSPRSAGGAGKIVLIFTAVKPLVELVEEAISKGNLPFYSKFLYFKPYSLNDLKKLFRIEEGISPSKDLDRLFELSGGHNQLLHILLNSQKQQNLLLDQFVKLQMKGLIDYLDYQQRKQVQKIALGKRVEEVDEYLLGVGMVQKKDSGYQLFTPLLTNYVKTNLPAKLPPQEAKLFKLLRNNSGQVVTKEEIFNSLWEDSDKGTDWALDALIYRLRNHPFMKSNGYIIESHKKIGYSLIQA
ncbi:helix-turn-helix domain-containing protein [Candidatus Daviesbacteria bacterium]|nr:helix-turn-helix domain-containing protein [Candidatus Daviesbacteria bacterium]